MKILGIDPGTTQSAYVIIDIDTLLPESHGLEPNEDVLDVITSANEMCVSHLAIEMIASYGMPVGESTFETVLWIGRFIERAQMPHTKVYKKMRREVDSINQTICKSNIAKDGNISQSLRDMYPQTGGGATPAVGTKSHPGPLYGIKKDIWSALAVAVTYAECFKKPKAFWDAPPPTQEEVDELDLPF